MRPAVPRSSPARLAPAVPAPTAALALAFTLALVCAPALGCEPTSGSPLPPDTAFSYDDTGASDALQDVPPREVAPADIGIYDAPAVEGGNCVLFPPGSDPPQALQCDPGSTCDVSGLWPLCARNEDAGVFCGTIRCVGYSCDEAGICVGFNDF